MKFPLRIALAVAAVLFFALAVYYFVTPANALVHFAPGYDASTTAPHTKHALAAALLGIGCLVGLWFSTGKKSGGDAASEASE
jgi:hypothetical protein